MTFGIAMRALNNDPYCGDMCANWTSGSTTTFCITDGLGHGKAAAEASAAAVGYVGEHLLKPLLAVFQGCDRAIVGTRGVAMAVAVVEPHGGTLTYAGIGNTRGMIQGQRRISLSSQYGIVGGGFRRLVDETLPLAPGDIVALWTDGVDEWVDISSWGAGVLADPQRLVERIVDDHSPGSDDAAALVYLNPW